eukprot:TRINITY_DN4089_c0_g1_i2.p1 TRINITY_DN4089_c0_g1~~TRINITY_DN4089_c0_g1_i2.p1  ORF type:complete len:158 (-),score=21.72 TRINITY_DN4089_c0_g1_i2:61-534(-)
MAGTIIACDFCKDPVQNFKNSLPKGYTDQQWNYFTQCKNESLSPFLKLQAEIQTAMNTTKQNSTKYIELENLDMSIKTNLTCNGTVTIRWPLPKLRILQSSYNGLFYYEQFILCVNVINDSGLIYFELLGIAIVLWFIVFTSAAPFRTVNAYYEIQR